jgi:hypothetical protein
MRVSRRRLFAASLFGLVLVGLGILLYVVLPAEPRWTIVGGPRDAYLFADNVIVTAPLNDGAANGPVQLWDVATGGEVARFLTDGVALRAHDHSRDGRYFVALVRGENRDVQGIRWLDVQERREWHVEARLGKVETALFSPDCDLVSIRQARGGQPGNPFVLVETATGRVVDRFIARAEHDEESNLSEAEFPKSGAFVGNGRCFAISYSDDEGTKHTRLINTRTGKVTDLEDAWGEAVSPDPRFLIIRRADGEWAWDAQAMDWLCPVAGPKPAVIASSDGRWIAVLAQETGADESPIEIRDAKTGKTWWRFAACSWYEARFSPDGRCFLLPAKPKAGQLQLTLYDVRDKKQLWQRSWMEDFHSPPHFTPDSNAIVVGLSDRRQVAILDAATGADRRTLPFPHANQLDTFLSRDGRTLTVLEDPSLDLPSFWDEWLERWTDRPRGREDLIHICDVQTGRERYRLPAELLVDIAWRTEDDGSVIIRRNEYESGVAVATTIICWDLPPRKPLRWVIGVPVAVGAALYALRLAVRLRRARSPRQTQARLTEAGG